jgi:hypothetical protein
MEIRNTIQFCLSFWIMKKEACNYVKPSNGNWSRQVQNRVYVHTACGESASSSSARDAGFLCTSLAAVDSSVPLHSLRRSPLPWFDHIPKVLLCRMRYISSCFTNLLYLKVACGNFLQRQNKTESHSPVKNNPLQRLHWKTKYCHITFQSLQVL